MPPNLSAKSVRLEKFDKMKEVRGPRVLLLLIFLVGVVVVK